MSPSDIGFSVYVTHINTLDTLGGFGSSQYEHVDTCDIHSRKTLLDFHHKKGASPLLYSHDESLVRIAFCVL